MVAAEWSLTLQKGGRGGKSGPQTRGNALRQAGNSPINKPSFPRHSPPDFVQIVWLEDVAFPSEEGAFFHLSPKETARAPF